MSRDLEYTKITYKSIAKKHAELEAKFKLVKSKLKDIHKTCQKLSSSAEDFYTRIVLDSPELLESKSARLDKMLADLKSWQWLDIELTF